MPENFKVFIGMPVYNGSRFIREALDSIISQSFTEWKLFISDDSSTDDTASIVREYTEQDRRITYYRQPKNLGLFENFKYTLDHADGKYFIWMAQDDLWHKDFLEACVRILEENDWVGLAGTAMAEIDSYGRTTRELPWLKNLSGKPNLSSIAHYILEPEILGRANIIYGLWKTECVKRTWLAYPQRRIWGQDYLFVMAGRARYGILVDERILFKKRLGGYSSPKALDKDSLEKPWRRTLKNPQDQIFPLQRFKVYFLGHLEALRGTPYQFPGAILMISRLPRAFINYIKEKIS